MLGKLTMLEGGDRRTVLLESGSLTLGRGEGNQIVLDDESASRVHARIDCTDEGVECSDLGSTNGTFVNGERLKKAVLGHGDEISIGATKWRFELAGVPPPTGTIVSLGSERQLGTVVEQAPITTIVADLSQPCVVEFDGGSTRRHLLSGEALVIGRDPNCDVTLDDPAVSQKHARVERRRDGFAIVDLQSRNGTFVGDRRVDDRRLHDGETIVVGSTRLAFKAGHAGLAVPDSALAGRAGRSPVVIVPGMMGSQLWRGSERVWPGLKALLDPKIGSLREGHGLEARGIVDEVVVVPNLIKLDQYNRLGSFLCENLGYERGKDLLEFAYDWRLDCRESARRLGAAIEAWRERSNLARGPVTVLAHSLGCLVSRYYIEHYGGKHAVDRLILMGGPHRGVPQAIPLLVSPRVLPFGLFGERLRRTISTFESVYQILPVFRCARDEGGNLIDVLEDESWLSDDQRQMLRDARSFRRELGSRSSVPTVCVFGYGLDTITGVKVRRGGTSKWERLNVAVERTGDETIPEMSAVLDSAGIHPVRQHHGSLYTDNDVKMRLVLELTRGIRPANG